MIFQHHWLNQILRTAPYSFLQVGYLHNQSMNLSESMKCGALEPLSRVLLCKNREGDDEDGQVEVERVVERDGKLNLEIAYTYTHTGTSLEENAKKNGCGKMFSGSNYEAFDEGDGEMLGARTFTDDDTCNEDQTTNCDHDESSSAYIPGAYTYDEESTTAFSKPFKTTVAPVQSFIYDALGVEQPQPQVEKQKSMDFGELASFNIATGTSSAAEIVDKSPSNLTRIRLCRTYKGDAISGMEVAFASEDDTCYKTENEEKSAVDDEDDVTERTSLNVTQDSLDSEYGSDCGVEVGIDDVDFMFEELALALPHDDDKISTTCSACGNEEDDISAVLSVQGGGEEKQDEHSDASTTIPRLQQHEHAVAKKNEAGADSKRPITWKKSFAKSHGLLGRSSKKSLASF